MQHRLVVTLLLGCIFNSAILFAQADDFQDVSFAKADSIARLYPRYSLKDISGLAHQLTKDLTTDVEKFRAIYLWVCTNIDNDYTLFMRNKAMREKRKPEELKQWNKKFSKVVFETMINNCRTICTGYAYLVRELALHAGLSCEMIDGYGRSAQANIGGEGIPNHTWNAIRLNNKWYLCDATWSTGAIDLQSRQFVKNYSNAYFLTEPSLFVRNHYPLDTAQIFLKKKPTLQEFLNGPVVYSQSFEYKIDSMTPAVFNPTVSKGEKLQFRFRQSDGRAIVNVNLVVQFLGDLDFYAPEMKKQCENFLEVEHSFLRRGTHVVHILLNGSYAFTYSVKVI